MCDKCVLIDKHDMCVLKSADKPLKKIVASESNNKPRNFTRKLYERVSKTCRWWYPKFTPSGYIWKPKSGKENVNPNVSMPLGKASRTANVMDIVTFRRSIVSNTPLSSNSFAAHRDCPSHCRLVTFRKSTCYIRDLKGNDLLTVIVDDCSRYTWTHFLRSKDETPEVLIDFLRLVQRGLQAQVRVVRTDKGTEFLNQTLHVYFAAEAILHQTSVARTPKQNSVVKRRNCTLVEAARTMLSAAKVPLFFWAEAIATACFTQNRSLVIPRHEKTPYHIINDRKSVFNKRTSVIMESIHVNFDELPQMASVHISSDPAPEFQTMTSDQNSSDPAPECQTVALEHDSLSLGRKCQENVSHGDKTVTTLNELDLLFSPMFDELLNGPSQVVSKSSAVTTTDESIQRQQQQTTSLVNHTTHEPSCQIPTIAPTVISSKNINQAEPHAKNYQVADDEFINIYSTLVQDQGETSSRHEELHQLDRLDVWELVERPLCTNVINLK
nr:hypothetical protein [Tanacetum cinerariifolium]